MSDDRRPRAIVTGPLSPDGPRRVDAYWRAANYLSVGRDRPCSTTRALLGFREATVADAEELGAWLRDHAVAETRDHGRLTACLEERCRALRIEPPTPDRVGRIVRSAVRAYEGRLFATDPRPAAARLGRRPGR